MPRGPMTAEHKAALAEGRRQGRHVRAYLEALERSRKPGRRVSSDELASRLARVQEQAEAEDDPARRLELIQQRLDLEDRLAEQEDQPDMASLEAAFIDVARPWSERKGISWTAWRELGVPAATLKKAGIPRTRRTS